MLPYEVPLIPTGVGSTDMGKLWVPPPPTLYAPLTIPSGGMQENKITALMVSLSVK
jgi:hypothetical protein